MNCRSRLTDHWGRQVKCERFRWHFGSHRAGYSALWGWNWTWFSDEEIG